MNLRPVAQGDVLEISILLDTVFEGPAEARLVQRLRDEGAMALELVAEDDDGIMGYIAFARMLVPDSIWSLSPVAVRQKSQGGGVGSKLIQYGLDKVRQSHESQGVVVLGAPEYYERFGFSQAAAADLTTPYPKEYTMFYPLAPEAAHLKAALSYPDAFSESQ